MIVSHAFILRPITVNNRKIIINKLIYLICFFAYSSIINRYRQSTIFASLNLYIITNLTIKIVRNTKQHIIPMIRMKNPHFTMLLIVIFFPFIRSFVISNVKIVINNFSCLSHKKLFVSFHISFVISIPIRMTQ